MTQSPAPSLFELTVYLEDVDAGGIVYHANYLKYAERARTEFLRARGFSHGAYMAEAGGGVIVSHLEIAYKSPALLEDRLAVETRIADIRLASAELLQIIRRGEGVVAELKVRLACVNKAGRPIRWPDGLKAALASD